MKLSIWHFGLNTIIYIKQVYIVDLISFMTTLLILYVCCAMFLNPTVYLTKACETEAVVC